MIEKGYSQICNKFSKPHLLLPMLDFLSLIIGKKAQHLVTLQESLIAKRDWYF